jgi:hypothetical protein
MFVLIGGLFQHALVLSENLRMKKAAESVQTTRNTELEALVKSQAEKITELEATFADLKREKENITIGYQKNTRHLLKKLNKRRQSL